MALSHLLDTSVYCQPLRKFPLPQVEARWRRLGDPALCVSVLCEVEILQGLEAKASENLWRAYRTILKHRLPILPVELKTVEVYAALWGKLSKRGRVKSPFDLLIAATAVTCSLTLATLNASDFSDIEGLAMEDWSS